MLRDCKAAVLVCKPALDRLLKQPEGVRGIESLSCFSVVRFSRVFITAHKFLCERMCMQLTVCCRRVHKSLSPAAEVCCSPSVHIHHDRKRISRIILQKMLNEISSENPDDEQETPSLLICKVLQTEYKCTQDLLYASC